MQQRGGLRHILARLVDQLLPGKAIHQLRFLECHARMLQRLPLPLARLALLLPVQQRAQLLLLDDEHPRQQHQDRSGEIF